MNNLVKKKFEHMENGSKLSHQHIQREEKTNAHSIQLKTVKVIHTSCKQKLNGLINIDKSDEKTNQK